MEENQPTSSKKRRIFIGLLKGCCALGLLWAFICSLDLLCSAFNLLWGRQAGKVFQDSKLLRNPIVGVMIGVLSTVLVQSSSTSTSIVVTMVGARVLSVRAAIPIVMGANIGTSVTNTLVSLGQVNDRENFRRAFAAATIHDMFNWLTVIVLLPIEIVTGYLESLTGAIMAADKWQQAEETEKLALFRTLTEPITRLVVQVDMNLLERIASGEMNETDVPSLLKICSKNGTEIPCGYLMENNSWSDSSVGALLLFLSLALLCFCLVAIIKILNSVLGGHAAKLCHRFINAELPYPYGFLTGYVAIGIGCAITVVLQSSSVFTSTLTPLAGVGLLSLERMYPLTLGANIGTTATGVLAAFSAHPTALKYTLQIAFCHLFFNLSGILLYYPIPATRLPISLGKILGSVSSKYRWFSIFYLIISFVVLPATIFGLSMAGPVVLASVGGPIVILLVVVVVINILQHKKPSVLPVKLRDWSCFPLWMHSLDPMDRCISRMYSCCMKQQEDKRDDPSVA